MHQGTKAIAALLLGGSALVAPQAALAAPSAREAQLEARLAKLEQDMAAMRAELLAARAAQDAGSDAAIRKVAAQAEAATARSAETATKLTALAAAPPPEGMRSGATTIKLGGYIKLIAAETRFSDGQVATNTLGRDFYLPQTIPVALSGARPTTDQDFTAKQTRLWLGLATTVAGHQLKGYVETDFQVTASAAANVAGGGSQRTTNGYTLALRRAYMQLDRWTIGQDWTTFQYVGALPESTDYVGGSEGTVFVREPLVRYSAPLSKKLTLHLALENPESATATLGAPALAENGADHLPDFAARLAYAGGRGEWSLGVLARQVRTETPLRQHTEGFGASAAGKLFLNSAKTADTRFMVTWGRNIGRYVGLNFGPDAVYAPASGRLEDVTVFAAMGSLHLPLGTALRANLMGSYQTLGYADVLPVAGLAAYNKRAWSLAGNLFYTPVKGVDLGIEYRHGSRELESGAKGQVDRVEFAAKYGF